MAGAPASRMLKRERPETRTQARRTLKEARQLMLASDLGELRVVDPLEALNLVMSRAMAHYRWAAIKADEVPEEGFFEKTMVGLVPNRWHRLEQQQGDRCAQLATAMVKNDLGERMARVKEAEAMLMLQSVRRVMDKLDLSPEQRMRLGPALREEAQLLRTKELVSG